MTDTSPLSVLVDYRPALRTRTGVGEYVHELAKGLLRGLNFATPDLDGVFASVDTEVPA